MKRLKIKTARSDLSVCFWKGPADAPILHWAHANGFNGLTYDKLLSKLVGKFNVYAWDTPGYGMSEKGPFYDEVNPILGYSYDLEALINELNKKHNRKILLGGHSIGGSLSLMVSKYIGDKISGLVLADPVVINYHYQYLTKYLSSFGYDSSTLKLTKQALRKRDRWDSFEAVLNSYTNRGIFSTWKDGFLKDYLLGGTKNDDNGIYLSCRPEIEAASFKNTEIVATPKIIKETKVPIILLVAQIGSTTASLRSFKRLRNLKKLEIIEGGTHFFPMEQPDKIISVIKGFKSNC
mgnify:FL=1